MHLLVQENLHDVLANMYFVHEICIKAGQHVLTQYFVFY